MTEVSCSPLSLTESAVYILKINTLVINNIAVSLYDITVVSMFFFFVFFTYRGMERCNLKLHQP